VPVKMGKRLAEMPKGAIGSSIDAVILQPPDCEPLLNRLRNDLNTYSECKIPQQ
jgi:hypothetical protein